MGVKTEHKTITFDWSYDMALPTQEAIIVITENVSSQCVKGNSMKRHNKMLRMQYFESMFLIFKSYLLY